MIFKIKNNEYLTRNSALKYKKLKINNKNVNF